MSFPGIQIMVPVLMKMPLNGPSHNASKSPNCTRYPGWLKSLLLDIGTVWAAYARANSPLSPQLSNHG